MYYNECNDPLPHFQNHVLVTKDVGKRERRCGWFNTVRQAERWIHERAQRSSKDLAEVRAGMYSIIADRVALRAYARLKHHRAR